MQRCPRTGVKEVDSYLDERSTRVCTIRRHVFTLIHPNICPGDVIPALVVGGGAAGVRQRRQATEVRDTAWFRIEPVEASGRAGEKLMDENRRKVWGPKRIATRNGHWLNLSP